MLSTFEASLRRLLGLRTPPKLALSVSGGVDSMALASLTSQWAKTRDVKLYGYIIDHHLRPNSTSEAQLVARRLEKLEIEPKILDLQANLVEPSVMEKFARHGRRDLLQAECVANDIHHILHGHTLDDQLELFIMRLILRSTWYGLAGMHASSYLSIKPPPDQFPIRLIKPLLNIRKSQLQDWCIKQNVSWVEDPSNMDVLLTKRNAIRALLADPSALPSAFSPESLIPLIRDLQTARDKVLRHAKLAFTQMQNSKDLIYKQGSVTLRSLSAFDQLPVYVKDELMIMIIALVTPMPVSQLLYRRQTVHNYVVEGSFDKRTFLDVNINPISQNELKFERSRIRSTQSLEYTVFKATQEWSEWKLIDNRFWIRWRLPEGSEVTTKNINARLLYSMPNFKKTLTEIFGNRIGTPYQRQTHPLFMFDDPEDPYTLRSDLIIGYPTLGFCRGLHMEWRPTTVVL